MILISIKTMAEDMILPLLGYNGNDEEDDTTDSDGMEQVFRSRLLIIIFDNYF